MFGLWAEYARLGQCCEATVGRPTQADFSCKTPFLEIARRLDAASLPSRCSNCVARRRPWQPRRRWPWGAVRQGPSARVGSGSSGVGGGFSYFFLCDQATCKRRRREGDIRGPSSLLESTEFQPVSQPKVRRFAWSRYCASMCSKGCTAVLELLATPARRSEEHTSELQSLRHLVCRLL